jgi:hypothetical protein
MRPVADISLKPVKDGFYDNVCDALRYGAENYYRALLRDPEMLDKLMENSGQIEATPSEAPWEWMNAIGAPA